MKFKFFNYQLSVEKTSSQKPLPSKAKASPAPVIPSDIEILSGLAEGIIVIDSQQKILICNQSMERLMNRPSPETLNLPLWETLRSRELLDLVDTVLKTKEEGKREISFSLSKESIWKVRARSLPLKTGELGAVLTFTDLTEIRQLERLRKDFVANVSHELKTPLTSLKGSIETLLEGALKDPQYAMEFLKTAQTQVERLERLIEDLLTLSRLEKDMFFQKEEESTSFSNVLKKVLMIIQPLAKKDNVQIENFVSETECRVKISEEELTQVLTNLLDNAVKFNRKKGTVRISSETTENKIEINVKDSGIGIPLESQKRIFERFYRVDKSRSHERKGTGLGLAIVKHIIENRGGNIRFKSSLGKGSEFIVSLSLH